MCYSDVNFRKHSELDACVRDVFTSDSTLVFDLSITEFTIVFSSVRRIWGCASSLEQSNDWMCCEGGVSGLRSGVGVEVGSRVKFIVSVAAVKF